MERASPNLYINTFPIAGSVLRQFSEGFSALSTTMTSAGAFSAVSFNPSCCCRAVKKIGIVGVAGHFIALSPELSWIGPPGEIEIKSSSDACLV